MALTETDALAGRLAVDQPLGGGDNYPFTEPNAASALVLDLYLAYSDDDCDFVRPFKLRWLYGFGDDVVAVPVSPTHALDVVVEDALGSVVFDSRTAGDFKQQAWGPTLEVVSWSQGEALLRLVRRTAVAPGDSHSQIYFEPTGAWLDERTAEQRQLRVETLRISPASSGSRGGWRLKNGYNTTLATTASATAAATRPATVVTLDCGPGLGLGQFGPGCDDAVDPILRRIGGVAADASGNFRLDMLDCYRAQRPFSAQIAGGPIPQIRVVDHSLQLDNDCGQCCECQSYVNTYEGVRKLRNLYADLFARAEAIRNQLLANATRFADQRDCRLANPLRVSAMSRCPDEIAFTVGFCNNSDACIHNLILPISFNYTGTTPDAVTTLSPPGSLPGLSPAYRGGNARESCCEDFSAEPLEFYQLGGAWPHFYGFWDRVDPGSMAYVSFSLTFSTETMTVTDDLIAFAVDAFHLPDGPTTDCIPIPDYDPSSGPTSPTTTALRKCSGPKRFDVYLTHAPCTTTSEGCA